MTGAQPQTMPKGHLPGKDPVSLIASDKVEGTAVYRADGTKIGRIEMVMIKKRDGRAVYAVMSFGGFLGMGEEHYPIPWSLLTYNERLGGYEVNLTDEQLGLAPHYARGTKDWNDPLTAREIDKHYGWVFI